jgi:hypothetical protein
MRESLRLSLLETGHPGMPAGAVADDLGAGGTTPPWAASTAKAWSRVETA